MLRSLVVVFCLSVVLVLASPASSAEPSWPGFRGHGNSLSPARDLPLKWSSTEGIGWRTELDGTGQSSPILWGNQVYVTTVAGPNKEKVLVTAVDLGSGKELWTHREKSHTPAKVSNYASFSAPTPVADAAGVYAFFETGNLVALDHVGKLRWQKNINDKFGAFEGNHGVGGSLAQTDQAIIVQVCHAGPSYVVALSKKTGEQLWLAKRPQAVSWTSPIWDGKGRLLISSAGTCTALEVKDGSVAWTVTGLEGNTVPSATIGDELVVVGSSVQGMNVAVRRGGKGDVTKTHIAWRTKDATTTFMSPLLYQEHVYMVNRAGVAFCLRADTGEKVWSQRLDSSCWASPLGAAGRVYFFCKTGKTTVVAAGAKLKVLAENDLPTTDRIYGLAVAEGKIVYRTGGELICLGEASKANAAKATKKTIEKKKEFSKVKTSSVKLPALPKAVTSFGAAVIGDSLYTYGGHYGKAHHYSSDGQSHTLHRLNLKTRKSWEELSNGPGLQGLAFVAYDGKLYRLGGFIAKNGVKEDQDLWSQPGVASFDPATKKWTDLPPMPSARSSFDAVVADGVIYVVGGWAMKGDEDAEWLETAVALDLKKPSLEWEALPAPAFKRRAVSLGALDGKIYVVGGMTSEGEATLQTAVFDITSRKWSEGPKLPTKGVDDDTESLEGFGSSTFAEGGKLYVSTLSGKLLRLNADGKAWDVVGQLETARFFHRMVPSPNGGLLLLGGASMRKGKFDTVEEVKP